MFLCENVYEVSTDLVMFLLETRLRYLWNFDQFFEVYLEDYVKIFMKST